jgi:hypothetical protein
MPVAFQVHVAEKFPEQISFQSQEQLSLLADDEQNQETAVTRVSLSSGLTVEPFVRYDAEHEFLFHLQFPGRARGKTFREFITPYKFPIFLGQITPEIAFRPLLVRTKKKVAIDFIHRLNKYVPDFSARPTSLNFMILRPRLELIRGAWFGSMQQPNISVAAVFGPHVDRSDEFKHAESKGELRNLQIEMVQGELAHTVMLAADGAIVLYNAYPSEQEELQVVTGAMTGLLSGCLSPAPL